MQTAGGEDSKEKSDRPQSTDKDAPVYWSKTERGLKAEERLQKHPYDTESWGILIREAQGQPMDVSRVLYERLVRRFPNAGRYWRLYIEQEVFEFALN